MYSVIRSIFRLTRLLCVAGVLLAIGSASASAAATPATITVDPATQLGVVPTGATGVNAPAWNPYLTAPITVPRLWQARIGTLVWQVGPATDLYDWKTGKLKPDPAPEGRPWGFPLDGPLMTPKYSFDEFAQRARAAGAEMTVRVNYGTGTPEEAAAWVEYANKARHYGVKRWEVGEEMFINGYLGVPWMPDGHADKSPAAYATNVLQFIKAMKAVDPSIEVGVDLAPAAAPTSAYWKWNETVMSIVGSAPDFADLHYYQVAPTDEALMTRASNAPATIARVRALLDANTAPGDHINLVVGEANSNTFATPQQVRFANAVYLADFGATLFENGVSGFDWYALYNGAEGDHTTGLSDLGLLSSGECLDGICQPPVGTPYPPFHGMRLLGTAMAAGDVMLKSSSSDPLIAVHAVRRNGDLVLLLLNKSPSTTYVGNLVTPGFDAGLVVPIGYTDATGKQFYLGALGCASKGVTIPPSSIMAVQVGDRHGHFLPCR